MDYRDLVSDAQQSIAERESGTRMGIPIYPLVKRKDVDSREIERRLRLATMEVWDDDASAPGFRELSWVWA